MLTPTIEAVACFANSRAALPLDVKIDVAFALGCAFISAIDARNQRRLAEGADKRVDELAPELENGLKEIRTHIQGVPYPFHHPREDITLDDFARTDIPATHKLEALYNDCTCHTNRLLPLYHRVLARLTFIALKVEEQI